MPQFEPVVLKDRAPTPVNHTFYPRDIAGGIATLAESAGTPLGEPKITLATNRAQNGRVKPSIRISVPVVQDVTVGGVTKPTLVRTNYASITFDFAPESSARERDDIVGYVEGLTAWEDNEMMLKYLVDLQGLY